MNPTQSARHAQQDGNGNSRQRIFLSAIDWDMPLIRTPDILREGSQGFSLRLGEDRKAEVFDVLIVPMYLLSS